MRAPGIHYGYVFYDHLYAGRVAAIMQRMTGEQCIVVPRGECGFLVVRSHGVIA